MAARTLCGSQPSRCPISAIETPSGREHRDQLGALCAGR